MNNQGTQKNPVRKAKTSGQIRRPLSHRVMSMLLTFLMVFTTVMPYTAFAEDSVLTDGAGDMELVGVSSGANGTEAEIVDASGDGESSLITDQADASSASGAQGSDSSAASGAGSDGSADASLDGLFEDEPDAASTDTAASGDTGAANTYLNEDTRTVYLVNRNSYADLQLWNENKTGDEADFWVQHVEKPGTDKEYDLYGSVTTDENGDVVPTDYAGSTSYRFEEIKLEKTEKKDAKGGDIYSADIPESWEYVVFSYFADDADLKEDTKLDDAGYPVSTASNGRHRTMVIKVDDKKTWTVMVPFTAEEKTEAGIDDDTPAWTNIDMAKTDALQAFYVNAEHYEDAEGQTYRKPMVERLDGKDDAESETAASETSAETTQSEAQSETAAESETAQSETAAETAAESEAAQSETVAAGSTETASKTDAQTTTEASPVAEIVGTNTRTTETEAGTETETTEITPAETTPEISTETKPVETSFTETVLTDSTESETVAQEGTEAESENKEEVTAESETQSETAEQAESESETEKPALPGRFNLFGGPRKAPANNTAASSYTGNTVYFWAKTDLSFGGKNWKTDTITIHYWGGTEDGQTDLTAVTKDYTDTSNSGKLYGFTLPEGTTKISFEISNWTTQTQDISGDSIKDNYCYYVTGPQKANDKMMLYESIALPTSTIIANKQNLTASVDGDTSKTLLVGETATLAAIASPTYDTQPDVTWTSTADGIVTFKDNTSFDTNEATYDAMTATITGSAAGSTTIHASAPDGVKDDGSTVTSNDVRVDVIRARLGAESLTFDFTKTSYNSIQNQLSIELGEGVTTSSVSWTADDASLLTIAKANDNAKSASIIAKNDTTKTGTVETKIKVTVNYAGNTSDTLEVPVTIKYFDNSTKRVYFWAKTEYASGNTWWKQNIYAHVWNNTENTTLTMTAADDYVDTDSNTLYYCDIPSKYTNLQFYFNQNASQVQDKTEVVNSFSNMDCFYISPSIISSGSNQPLKSFNLLTDDTQTITKKETKLTLSPETTTIMIGETATLTAAVDSLTAQTYSGYSPAYSWNYDPTEMISLSVPSNAKVGMDWDDEDTIEEVSDFTSGNASDEAAATDDANVDSLESTADHDSITGSAALEVEPTQLTQASDSISTAAGSNSITVTGLKEGTATVYVTAPDAFNSSNTVKSNTVTINVVSAKISPDPYTLDISKKGKDGNTYSTTTEDADITRTKDSSNNDVKYLTLNVSVSADYDTVKWSIAPDTTAEEYADYTDELKTAMANSVSIAPDAAISSSDGSDTAGDVATDYKKAVVSVINSADLPTEGKYIVTATLMKGGSVVSKTTSSLTVKTAEASYQGTIYYDATLSKLQENGEVPKYANSTSNSIPVAGTNDVYVAFYSKDNTGTAITTKKMTKEAPKSVGNNTYNDVYSVSVPTNAYYVRFADSDTHLRWAISGNSNDKMVFDTGLQVIPTGNNKYRNCFYADTADPYVYKTYSTTQGTYRPGYWDKAYTIRDPHKEATVKKETLDNNGSKTTAQYTSYDKQVTKWIPSTFFDYYSDAELNGLNRADNFADSDNNTTGSCWNYYTFRQFDQAVSDYYPNDIVYPMYTGHFQPSVNGWGHWYFNDVNNLGLKGERNYNVFRAVNNSNGDFGSGATGKYDMALQGLVGGSRNNITSAGTSQLLPFFNASFLSGNNSKNAVLGKVYNNIAFPFTYYDRDGNGVYYYGFDSARTTVHMENGYLSTTSQADYKTTADEQKATYNDTSRGDLWSLNTDSSGKRAAGGVSNEYGFFPLNKQNFTGPSAMENNYGFGCKLQFQFSLNENGDVVDKDGNLAPQAFTFSGDDDVWVFIDDTLVLDMGGDHGRVTGVINFSSDTQLTNYSYYTDTAHTTKCATIPAGQTFVSKVKYGAGSNTEYANGRFASPDKLKNLGTGEHTLTMYYMERGQWESNMKVEFNILPTESLNIKKQFQDNGTDVTSTTTGTVYAMITRTYTKSNGTTSTEEIVPIPGHESATDTKTKYCIELSDANQWQASITKLPQFYNQADESTKYKYVVKEVMCDYTNNGATYTVTPQIDASKGKNGYDTAGVGIPLAADEGDIVKVGDKSYVVGGGVVDDSGIGTTLVNTRKTSTKLTLEKTFSGTDDTTLPTSIRVRVERVVGVTNSNNQIVVPENPNWEPVKVNGSGDNGWVTIYKSTATSSTDSNKWTKTFEGLQVNPDDIAANGIYIYRVVEATGPTSKDVAEGGESVTYGDNSYFVYYTDDNGNLATKTGPDSASGNYDAGIVKITNTLIVHLPSTGSRSAMTLTILSLICLAAAGSFGIFGRKKETIE